MPGWNELTYFIGDRIVTRQEYDAWLKSAQGFTDLEIEQYHRDAEEWAGALQ